MFVTLPQQWWIHIAQRDFSETLDAYAWLGPAIAGALVGLALVLRYALRPRLPAHDWSWHLAADPLSAETDTVAERNRWVAARGRLWSVGTLEKVVLVGLLWGSTLRCCPIRATSLQLFLGTAAFVVVNAAIGPWVARGARGAEPVLLAFGARVVLNVGLVLLGCSGPRVTSLPRATRCSSCSC
ncbi:MAG TPA: hypothetical protein VI011_23165 [Asanoa sp.]